MSPRECCTQVKKICSGFLAQRVSGYGSSAEATGQRCSAWHMIEDRNGIVSLSSPLQIWGVRKIVNYGAIGFCIALNVNILNLINYLF